MFTIDNTYDEEDSVQSFDQLGLKQELLSGLYKNEYLTPSHCQQRSLPMLLKGRDVILSARAGSGKTIACIIAVMQLVDASEPSCQALVLCPTRQVARQTLETMNSLGSRLQVGHVVGGVEPPTEAEERKYQIIIGTPGRMLDRVQKHRIEMNNLLAIILDEADELLSRGFQGQLLNLMKLTQPRTQLILSTPTLPHQLELFCTRVTRQAVTVIERYHQLTLDGIKQYFVAIEKEDWKPEILLDLLKQMDVGQVIIYVNSPDKVAQLTSFLRQGAIVVTENKSTSLQEEEQALKKLRIGQSRCTVSTDFKFRGSPSYLSTTVINYELPTLEKYIMRAGRSGCFGRRGLCISFVAPDQLARLMRLRKYYNTSIEELPTDISNLL